MGKRFKSLVCDSEVFEVVLTYEKNTCYTLKMPTGISDFERVKLIEKSLGVLDEDGHSDFCDYDFDVPSEIKCRVLGRTLFDVDLEIKLDVNGEYKLFYESEVVE